jgi:hypothetical protein
MNKLIAKLEDIMVAVTFAESGEYDEATRISGTAVRSREAQEHLGKTVLESAGK